MQARPDTETNLAGAPAAGALESSQQGEVLSRAELISRSLKDVSRDMRRASSGWGIFYDPATGRSRLSFGMWILLAFAVAVIVPVTLSGLYLAVWSSDQYATEARFTVRGGEKAGGLAALAGLGGAGTARIQETMIVADYIRGRGMVEELNKTLDLRAIYARPDADFLARFDPSRSMERLTDYWWWRVSVNLESISGIVTVIVRAFTPEDSLKLARGIVSASEKLVNEMSERSRHDALRLAQSELSLAERALQDKIKAMRELRDREGLLDAAKTSEVMTKVVGDLRYELAQMQGEYAAQRRSVRPDSPQLRLLESRIATARDQIAQIEAQMTAAQAAVPSRANASETAPAGAAAGSAGGRDPVALADSMARFDRLRLEQEIAQQRYVQAAAVLERARVEVETQQLYLATVVEPVLAQEALYPKRWWIFAAIVVICLALWGAGTGITILARNYTG